jgi:hypothetical protein
MIKTINYANILKRIIIYNFAAENITINQKIKNL